MAVQSASTTQLGWLLDLKFCGSEGWVRVSGWGRDYMQQIHFGPERVAHAKPPPTKFQSHRIFGNPKLEILIDMSFHYETAFPNENIHQTDKSFLTYD
jgi:hypothetical protein